MKNRIIIIFGIIVLILLTYNFPSIRESMIFVKYGSIGRDTVLVVGDGKFQVARLENFKVIIAYDDKNNDNVLLSRIIGYKKSRGKLYVSSKEGYAVIDAINSTSKVLITVKERDFYETPKLNNITYLSSFNQFSEQERRILDHLSK